MFDAAGSTAAILLLDDTDALFERRTEMKNAHDRYANLEMSYVLQRMEEFSGLAVLTTNQKKDVDEGFLRRM